MFQMEINDSELSEEKLEKKVLNEIKEKYKIEKVANNKFEFKEKQENVKILLEGNKTGEKKPSKDEDTKTNLVLGTLNILGEAENPI